MKTVCDSCKNEVSQDSKFCVHCGSQFLTDEIREGCAFPNLSKGRTQYKEVLGLYWNDSVFDSYL